MNLEQFYKFEDPYLRFTRQQASDFAKRVAGDFNPIHDIAAKRFCVPGDLLFSLIVKHYGLHSKMDFSFLRMVGDSVKLVLPEKQTPEMTICDENHKKYLHISSSGEISYKKSLVNSLVMSIAEFSGYLFPTILVPVMRNNNVMFNTEPLFIIYNHMHISLYTFDIDYVTLELSEELFHFHGRRGSLTLNYNLTCNNKIMGHGKKVITLCGLKEYDQVKIDNLIAMYNEKKSQFQNGTI